MDRASGNPKELLLQLVQENDLRRTNRFAMTGLGWLAQTTLGEGPVLDGLACTSGEGLNVSIAPGAIYQIAPVDTVAYGDLPADPHLILKQGLMQNPAILNCPAPETAGQSIAYLVQAVLQEADIQEPDGEGPAETTVRADRCVVSLKAGVAAPTGSQTPPVPDEGKVVAWVVTVTYGQTSVTDIVRYPGAPFLAVKLPQAAPLHSPVFTGDPQAPTPAAGDDDDSIATTAFVQAALSDAGAGAFFALKSGSVTTPPSTPALGDGYLVPNEATGAWRERVGQIAIWRGETWRFISASEGVTVILADTGLYHRRVAGGWRPMMADAAEHVAGLAEDLFANPAGVQAAQDAYLHGRETAKPAPDDELLIYDSSANANRKITLSELISMPEFDTAQVGEIRPFAGQPSDDWAPANGGTLSQEAYPELFGRVGHVYMTDLHSQNGFSASYSYIGSRSAFYAFGKYWLFLSNSVESGENNVEYLQMFMSEAFNGPATHVIQNHYLNTNGAGIPSRMASPSFGAGYGVIPLGVAFNRTHILVFNESSWSIHSLPNATSGQLSAKFATDGASFAYSTGGFVYRKSVSNFASGSGSWANATVPGKTTDAFGLVYNAGKGLWVTADQSTGIWAASDAAGPFTKMSPAPSSVRDMIVLDDTYILLTSNGLYASDDLVVWRSLGANPQLANALGYGAPGTALMVGGNPVQATDGNIRGPNVSGIQGFNSPVSWDGSGLISAGGTIEVAQLQCSAPLYDATQSFLLPNFAVAVGAPPYFIKVK